MAARPRLATIEIVFFLAAIFFTALNVHRAITFSRRLFDAFFEVKRKPRRS